MLAQEAVPDKANELAAIPVLLDRLAVDDGLKGAIVTIDALACNATVAKANQPTLRKEIAALFDDDATQVDRSQDIDKGHGRIEQRTASVAHEVGWFDGTRRFPGELRLSGVASVIKVEGRTELNDRCRFDTRYSIPTASLSALKAARGHWAIENPLHWGLDVVFKEDQSRPRKGHGAVNMAVVRHFSINLVRHTEIMPPERRGFRRPRKNPALPKPVSLIFRRKMAGWDTKIPDLILKIKGR